MKVKTCTCEQCKGVKNKRKNRKLKARIKRLLNKKRRRDLEDTEYYTHYWA